MHEFLSFSCLCSEVGWPVVKAGRPLSYTETKIPSLLDHCAFSPLGYYVPGHSKTPVRWRGSKKPRRGTNPSPCAEKGAQSWESETQRHLCSLTALPLCSLLVREGSALLWVLCDTAVSATGDPAPEDVSELPSDVQMPCRALTR